MDWKWLYWLYGAWNIDESGRLRWDLGEQWEGGAEASMIWPASAHLTATTADVFNHSRRHDEQIVCTEPDLLHESKMSVRSVVSEVEERFTPF